MSQGKFSVSVTVAAKPGDRLLAPAGLSTPYASPTTTATSSANQAAERCTPYMRIIHTINPTLAPAPKASRANAAPTELPCWNIEASWTIAVIGVA